MRKRRSVIRSWVAQCGRYHHLCIHTLGFQRVEMPQQNRIVTEENWHDVELSLSATLSCVRLTLSPVIVSSVSESQGGLWEIRPARLTLAVTSLASPVPYLSSQPCLGLLYNYWWVFGCWSLMLLQSLVIYSKYMYMYIWMLSRDHWEPAGSAKFLGIIDKLYLDKPKRRSKSRKIPEHLIWCKVPLDWGTLESSVVILCYISEVQQSMFWK